MVKAAGVDTWSVCWYLREGSRGHRAIEALATERGPRSRLLPEKVNGYRVGWFPGTRLLFAEGHPDPGRLAQSDSLMTSFEGLQDALHERGVFPPSWKIAPKSKFVAGEGIVTLPVVGGTGFAGVRRLDSTVNLGFDDPLVGQAVLAGVAALPLPRIKKKLVTELGGRRIETVYLHGWSGRRVLGRMYDKGIESGEAPRGMLIRPEDQRRYASETRPPLEALVSTSYVRDSFVRRFEPLWRASKGVKVGSTTEIARRIGQLVDEGVITPLQAVRLAGHINLDAAGVAEQVCTRSTYMRHRAEVRDQGLVLAQDVDDEVEIDLGEIMEEALDSSAWGAQG